MEAVTQVKLKNVLTRRLKLRSPRFDLEKLPSGRISGSVVSDTFKGVSDSVRQKRIWDALDAEYGETSARIVGTLLAYSDAEWDLPLIEN